ncbi:MAG TPA: serine hydrolase [Candidatus Saccharimonadales bacterium]|nr:serine hydrolase [Candidatus Saccharimonadales bacterium]
MKKSQSPIWQKKRKRKFKNTKSIHVSAPSRQTHPDVEKEIFPSQKKVAISKPPWFKNLFPKNEKKEKAPKSSHLRSSIGKWLQKYDSDLQLILFPLILLVILIILHIVNSQLFLTLSKQNPISDDNLTILQPYPYVDAVSQPTISAQSAIILDRGSQVILFSKNPQLRFSMASTTKIMTALVAFDYYKSNDILTVKRSYVEGSGLNFYAGEQFRFIDLMYAMLLPSANDAAQAIADNYPGGADAFVAKMNQKAQSLHLTSTHYSDPIGLDDDHDYSTVIDMARLASYAVTLPNFVDITSTKYKTISSIGSTRQYPLVSTNELLGIDGVTGIKTGTTEGAGEVLVSSVVKKNHTYIIVVMDSQDRFADTSKLLNFIDTSVKYIVPPQPPN